MEGLDGGWVMIPNSASVAHSGLDLGDRVLVKREIIVLYLCLQGGPQWACASQNCLPCRGGIGGSFTAVVKGVADKIRVCAGPLFL